MSHFENAVTVSNERREAVAQAIANEERDGLLFHPPNFYHRRLADVVLAAALPNRVAFEAALDDVMDRAFGNGMAQERGDGNADRNTMFARDALIALVYGEQP